MSELLKGGVGERVVSRAEGVFWVGLEVVGLLWGWSRLIGFLGRELLLDFALDRAFLVHRDRNIVVEIYYFIDVRRFAWLPIFCLNTSRNAGNSWFPFR